MTITHKDDYEALAAEVEERKFVEGLDEESFENLVNENVFEADVIKEKKVILFAEDGDYGWITFSGVFENLETILNLLNKENRQITVTEADTEENVDVFLVNVSAETPEILYGVKIVPNNSFVNMVV